MSSSVDRILDLLDNATQDSGEASYGTGHPDACWRCHGPAGDGASGVCDECRTVLLDETTQPTERGGHRGMVGVGMGVFPRTIVDITAFVALEEAAGRPRTLILGGDEIVDITAFVETATVHLDRDFDHSVGGTWTQASELTLAFETFGDQISRIGDQLRTIIDEATVTPSPHARGRRRRPRPTPNAPPCRHGNPRNACRDCSMGRRR